MISEFIIRRPGQSPLVFGTKAARDQAWREMDEEDERARLRQMIDARRFADRALAAELAERERMLEVMDDAV
jgi:hypothetical protein